MNTTPVIAHHQVPTNGLKLHCASCGELGRPLVILLHGFPECWFAWEAQLLDLGRDFFVLAPDLRGFNLSDKPTDVRDYRAGRVARDIAGLADAFGHKRFFLVGHDWGGAIAYTVTLAYPERVARLALLNAVHPAVFARELRESEDQARASNYISLFRQPHAAQVLAQDDFAYLTGMFEDEGRTPAWRDGATLERYKAAWAEPGAIDGGLNYYRASPLHPLADDDASHAAPLPDDDDSATRVKVATLVLWGMRDRFLLPGCLRGLERYVPDLRIERFPKATHWIAHEEPESVSRLLRSHFNSTSLS